MPVAGPALAVVLCWSLLACSNAGDAAYGRGMDLYSAKRYAEAATHLKQAAHADHVLGMATLASMLLKGEGVPRDTTQAGTWLSKAAGNGDKQSAWILENLAELGVARF